MSIYINMHKKKDYNKILLFKFIIAEKFYKNYF